MFLYTSNIHKQHNIFRIVFNVFSEINFILSNDQWNFQFVSTYVINLLQPIKAFNFAKVKNL